MAGPIKRIMFRGALMTASEIASQNGLSLATVLYRIRQGRPDAEIAAAPFSIPRGKQPAPGSNREMTVAEAQYHLKRARKSCDRHTEHHLSAIRNGEPPEVVRRLKLAADKSQQSLMYWNERVRAIRILTEDVAKATIKVPGRRGWVEPEVRLSHLEGVTLIEGDD